MKIKAKYYSLFLSIGISVISGNGVRAEDITLKDLCSNRNPKCDAVSYTSKIYNPTYDKDSNKSAERLRELGWKDIESIDVSKSTNTEGKVIDIDAQAIVAKRVIEGKIYYLVSFRGTESKTDERTDALGFSKELTNGGEVHAGFFDYTSAVYNSPEFRKKLDEIIADSSSGKPYEILLTGHSLGGASAQLMTYFLTTGNGLPSNNIKTVVFGSPSPGNKVFTDRYLKNVIRAEITDDPIPFARNPFFTNVDYGTKIKFVAGPENKQKLEELQRKFDSISVLDIVEKAKAYKELGEFKVFVIHMEYEKEVERIYEEFRISRILKNNSLLDMNSINSCYTSQGSSHITSASCYISRAPEESLFFPGLVNSLPQTPEKKSEYTDGQIVRAPLDITLTWDQNTKLDLDSHLATPNNEHIYFVDRGNLTSAPNAFLYRDSIPAGGLLGAEQTRVTTFQNGEYRFYVHNYSQSIGASTNPNGLSTSNAEVKIFEGGKPLTNVPNDPNNYNINNPAIQSVGADYPNGKFNVPTTQPSNTNTWYVFKLNTRTGILREVNGFGNATTTNVPTVR